MAQHVAALQESRRAVTSFNKTCRSLKLLYGLVNEVHLFVCRPHVVMGLEIFSNSVTFFSDTKLFEELGQTRINSCCNRRGTANIIAAVLRSSAGQRRISSVCVESCRFSGYRSRRQLFYAAKLKNSRGRLFLSARCKLLATRLNIRMRPKLPFEHLERIDSNIRVTLNDIKIYALQLLAHHGFKPRFFRWTRCFTSSFSFCRRHDAEINFLKIAGT